MTDVFIRYNPKNALRKFLALAAFERWKLEREAADIRLHVIHPGDASVELVPEFDLKVCSVNMIPGDNFWTRAKQAAEDRANSGIYVVADDDQLIIGKNWVERGVKALEAHPEFGLLAAHSVNGEVKETADGDDQIFTMHSSVGCPYFMRKGSIRKFPEAEGGNQDTEMCNLLWQKGWKYGFIRGLRFNHLGCEYSTIAPGHWGA